MAAFVLSPENFLFSIAICIVVLLLLVEVLSLLFGTSLLSMGDDIASPEHDGFQGTALANWLNINRVPLLVWLIVFLTVFSLSGFIVNGLSNALFSNYFPPLLSVTAAIIFSLFITPKMTMVIATLLPTIETSAKTTDDFAGSVAEVTLGKASKGHPAEAKFIDDYSQSHYVLVEPIDENTTFLRGDLVILVQKNKTIWLATRYNPL